MNSLLPAVSPLVLAGALAGLASAQGADPYLGPSSSPELQGTATHPDDPTQGVNRRPAGAGTVLTFSSSRNAVDFNPGSGSCGGNQAQTIGYEFDLAAPITVCAMTWFDDGQDGLELPHEVGIWDPMGNLIGSTNVTIPGGTLATLDGIWRKVDITPTILPAGSGYIVGGLNGVHNECLSFNVTQAPDSAISYVGAKFSQVNGIFELPSNTSGASNGFYGVSFQLEEANPSKQNALGFVEGSGSCAINSNQTIGWQFNVDSPVTVTSMSWYDENQDGLEIAHEVALWGPGGNVIPGTNVTIPAGTAATLEGNWRTVSIPSVTLPVGQGYIVGGYNGVHTECVAADVTQIVYPFLTYVDATFSPFGPTLERPTGFSVATNGFYGASFRIADEGEIGTPYCPANANSVSAGGAVLSSTGGYGSDNATFEITDVPNQPGLLYAGPNQLNLPFGCGRRCVGGAVVRGTVLFPSGNAVSATFDMSVPGFTLDNIQYWYRDPANLGGCGDVFNLSNALRP